MVDKYFANRSLLEILNDSLQKSEMEAKEKNDLIDQLNKVGSELCKEIDVKDSEIKQLEVRVLFHFIFPSEIVHFALFSYFSSCFYLILC